MRARSARVLVASEATRHSSGEQDGTEREGSPHDAERDEGPPMLPGVDDRGDHQRHHHRRPGPESSGSSPRARAGTWRPPASTQHDQPARAKRPRGVSVRGRSVLVGDTGFEPVTSSVSRKRATTAPIARGEAVVFVRGGYGIRTRVDGFAVRCLASRPTHRGGFGFSPSGRRGSNSRPQPWQGCALPTELRPLATTGFPAVAWETIAQLRTATNSGAGTRGDASGDTGGRR